MNDEQKIIWESAVRMLNMREHSRFELKRKQIQRHFNEKDVEWVLDQLETEGLQSDSRFTEQYIYSRSNKGYGPARIKMELKEKGLNAEHINTGFQESDIDWFEQIKKVQNKKFKGEIAADWNDKSKQMKFLEYRGFTYDQIRSCVDDNEID